MSGKNLLLDADDTLWENNIYFERVIASVQALLETLGVDPSLFREHLNETERDHIVTHGYGVANFTRSLVQAFEEFLPPGSDPALSEEVRRTAIGILDHPVEVLEGVPETLDYLSGRHELFLVTKGEPREQEQKIEASSLKRFFVGIEILPEKKAPVYRGLVARHRWDPNRTWMIGNSPRSDINPALSAGLGAVYIPHANTWILEHEEPRRGPRLLELETFTQLRDHF